MLLSFKSFLKEERFLLENRIDFLRNKYKDLDPRWDTSGHSTANGAFNLFAAEADPTTNKKYLDWILRQYSKQDFRQEDTPRIRVALLYFEQYKNHIQQKDINKYQRLSDLEDAIDIVRGAQSKREIAKETKHDGADKIFDKDGVTVYHIKTEAAAKLYGKGTRWCTAAENGCQFAHYNKQGPLYVVHAKNSVGELAKYQFHFESDQLKDEKDRSIDLPMLVRYNPELKEVPAWQGRSIELTSDKNFGKYFNQLIKSNNSLNVVQDPRVTDEIIQNALQSPEPEIRKRILTHLNITKEQLAKALNDPHEDVRYNVIVHPNVTKAHLKRASEDFIKRNKEKAKERLTRGLYKE